MSAPPKTESSEGFPTLAEALADAVAQAEPGAMVFICVGAEGGCSYDHEANEEPNYGCELCERFVVGEGGTA